MINLQGFPPPIDERAHRVGEQGLTGGAGRRRVGELGQGIPRPAEGARLGLEPRRGSGCHELCRIVSLAHGTLSQRGTAGNLRGSHGPGAQLHAIHPQQTLDQRDRPGDHDRQRR